MHRKFICLYTLRLRSTTCTTLTHTTMENEPLHHCHDCKRSKHKNLFKLRERNDQHGQKGEPTHKCLECTSQNQKTRHSSKRKRDDSDPDTSESPPRTGLVISIEQFTTTLTKLARQGVIHCCTHVSMQELGGDDSTNLDVIIQHIWEATGFRFTSVHAPSKKISCCC